MGSFLEERVADYMPTKLPVYRVNDVDAEQWAQEGVRGLLLDVEGTLGETGASELLPEYVDWVVRARDAGIDFVGLWTNKTIDSVADRQLLRGWQEQVGADLVLSPDQPSHAKPSTYGAHQAMQYFGLKPQEMGMIGDKATADMRAAALAGIEHRAWTRPFGGHRHIGDKLVRDPVEIALRMQAHLQFTPKGDSEPLASGNLMLISSQTDVETLPEFGLPDGLDNIVGFGLSDIELPEHLLADMQSPVFRKAFENLQELFADQTQVPADKIRAFLYEHGRTAADALTYSRLAITAGVALIHFSNLSPDTKRKLHATLLATAYATDGLDGFAGRGHKDGATAKGGDDDQRIDKALTATADLLAMVPAGLLSRKEAGASILRDVALTLAREPFKARGMDTKSIRAGKNALMLKAAAQLVGLALGPRNPHANWVLQKTATGLKIVSAVKSADSWLEQQEFKNHIAIQSRRAA